MCGCQKAEIIRTNTFMETSTNPVSELLLPHHHHTDLPLPDLASIKGMNHPLWEPYRNCQEEYGVWSLPGLALQFDSTISQLCVFGQVS